MASWQLTLVGFSILFFFALVLLLRACLRRHFVIQSSLLLWFLIAFSLIALAVFPEPAISLMTRLGFQVPANGIFFLAIGFLMFQVFLLHVENAKLRAMITDLVQEIGLKEQ